MPATAPFDVDAATDRLRQIGREFHSRGWSLGTSSNYSIVASRDPLELLITASGRDKSSLGPDDFVRVDSDGRPIDRHAPSSSAETLLHCLVASRIPSVGAVLHTHSPWATVLSLSDRPHGSLRLEGYEMLKGLSGIRTHETFEAVPIFANSQDMRALAVEVADRIASADFTTAPRPPFHGFLLAGHGLYTWGIDVEEARRHVEIFEFLFQVEGMRRAGSII